jgi:hypothetical protein
MAPIDILVSARTPLSDGYAGMPVAESDMNAMTARRNGRPSLPG